MVLGDIHKSMIFYSDKITQLYLTLVSDRSPVFTLTGDYRTMWLSLNDQTIKDYTEDPDCFNDSAVNKESVAVFVQFLFENDLLPGNMTQTQANIKLK